MARMKFKELKDMSKEEREKKMKELKIELIKSKSKNTKKGGMKPREIKRIIAQLHSTNK